MRAATRSWRWLALAAGLALLAAGCAARQDLAPWPRSAPPVSIDSRRSPAASDTLARRGRLRRAARSNPAWLARQVARDTTAIGLRLRRCSGRRLLPAQESIRDATASLLRQTRLAMLRGDYQRAHSLTRNARQLVTSFNCR